MREATWEGIGTKVQGTTVDTVLKEANLDYDVELRPVFMGNGMKIPNSMVAVRLQDEHPFGIVSPRYKVVQNRDAFDFVNYLSDEVTFEKAGETESGMVYIIGRLPEKNILGDKFIPHVIFRNSFAKQCTIAAAISPLRHICSNQFNFVFKNAANAISIRHMGSPEQQMVEARETLKLSYRYMEELDAMSEHYAAKKVSDRQIDTILDEMFPLPDNASGAKEQIVRQAKHNFMAAYNAEDNINFKGTGWGLVNAWTDFRTHETNKKTMTRKGRERRFAKVSFERPMNRILDVIDQTT